MSEDFESEGFLSDETDVIRKDILNLYPRIFAICKDINRQAHQLRNSISLDYENELHIVVICLFQRILDSFQSIIILMESGLESDCNTITRSSIEATLQLRKLSTDKMYLEKYLGSDQLRRRKILNSAKNNPRSVLGEVLQGPQLESTLSKIIKDIDEMKLCSITIEAIARDVGLESWYDLTYRVLSEEVHAGPRSLEKYITHDPESGQMLFNFNPKVERLVAVLVSNAAIVLIAMDSLEKIFHLGFESIIERLFSSIKEFNEN